MKLTFFFFFGSKKNIFSKRNIVFSGKKFFKCMITVSRVFYFLKTIKTSDNRLVICDVRVGKSGSVFID